MGRLRVPRWLPCPLRGALMQRNLHLNHVNDERCRVSDSVWESVNLSESEKLIVFTLNRQRRRIHEKGRFVNCFGTDSPVY